jgi:two-component system, NtrC family, sensor histidine kinase PilS
MQDSSPSAQPQIFRLRPYSPPSQEALWRTMLFFNLYRLILGVLLVFLFGKHGEVLQLSLRGQALFYYASVTYAVSVLASLAAIQFRKPAFSLQLASQIGIDIACVAVLTYASGGVQFGLGILLLVSLAAAGMISRGRITLFFAAVASITMLLEHFYAVLTEDADIMQYFQVGLLSIAYFAVAWSAHTLAKYAVASERLASQRGAELASMAEANRLVIQGLPDGVLVVDESGAIRQFNPSAERLLGCDFSRAGGATLQTCAPLLADMFAAWRRDRAPLPDGLRLPVTDRLVRVRFLPVRQENFGGALLMLEDMQRVQAQARQIKLAALGRLTANIAHEIRNPLSAISYAVELFREEKEGPAQERLVDIIMENTRRLNSIVKDVMQLNRRDRAQAEPVALADELIKFSREICQAEHAPSEMLSIDAQPDCAVAFDRGHLNQVLWNLCSNAMRYCSKRPGSVKMSTRKSADGVVSLEVCDDGAGVSPTMEQQLFEPFFTTESSGTGLGLYIARELCEANGASLEYVRRPEGGACFRIIFGGVGED